MKKLIITDKNKINKICKPCESVEEGEEIGVKLLNFSKIIDDGINSKFKSTSDILGRLMLGLMDPSMMPSKDPFNSTSLPS